MRQKLLLPLLAFLLLGLWLAPGSALASKLDARARIALSQLRAGIPAGEVYAQGAAVTPNGQLDVFIRGSVTRSDLEALGVQVQTELPGLFTAYVPAEAIDQVEALPGVVSVRGAVLAEPNLDVSVPTTGANLLRGAGPVFAGLNGAGILVGDVDSGIDIKHGDFKDAAGLSRILYIWDQTVAGTPPAGYSIGTEWTKAQIDGGTCTETDPGVATSGGGHGTHVMGIAAGDGSATGGSVPAYTYAGMAPKADIVEVKTTFYTTDILNGVAYIMGKATALAKNAVVNLSLGSQYGPHDGTSDFESGLTALTGPGHIITVSAGNDRGSSKHAQTFAAGAGSTVTMSVSGSANGRLLAIDGYYEGTEAIDIKITSPSGTVIGPLSLGGINAAYPGATYTGAGRVYFENGAYVTPSGAREVYVEITGLTGNSINGSWTFTFIPVSLGAKNGQVDLWRFYTSTSSLVAQFFTGMSNSMLVSEPGCATGVITTAAWETKNGWIDCGSRNVSYLSPAPIGAIATFSSPGPTRDGRQKPDLAAPGMGIGSARSADATGLCGTSASSLLNDGGIHVINQGTSMAAPHVAGAAALLMQKYGALTPDDVKAYLFGHAVVDANTGVVWNADFGRGKLNLGDLVDPQVTVQVPNGGESLLIGSGTVLQWTATDNVGVTAVDLYLSRAGAAGPWETVALGAPNTGSFGWNATGPATTNALLKVVAHDANGNAGTDVSDAAWALFDGPTPTLVALVDATADADGVRLSWSVAVASPVHLYRALESGAWQLLATLTPDGDGRVAYTDAAVSLGTRYGYRLGVASGGREVVAGETWVTVPAQAVFALHGGRPNPSTGPLAISFSLADASPARLELVDLNGRRVVDREVGSLGGGFHVLPLDGGARLPVGLYLVRLSQHGNVLKSKVSIVR